MFSSKKFFLSKKCSILLFFAMLSLFPAPWRYWFLLCHYGSMFLSMTYKWNCRICTTSLPQHSAFEIQFSEFAHFSVWVRPVCLSIHPLKNIWIVSALVLLQTKLLWTFLYVSCDDFSKVNAQEGLLDHMVSICLTLRRIWNCHPKQLYHLALWKACQCSSGSAILLTVAFVCSFHSHHFNQCVVRSQNGIYIYMYILFTHLSSST